MKNVFTELQITEIKQCIYDRMDTVEDDVESASGIELDDNGLQFLLDKINDHDSKFTSQEIEWLTDELENRINIAESNRFNEAIKVNGYINSMRNAIEKAKFRTL